MKKNNKICICCGKSYSFCTSCRSTNATNSQRNLWDTENCKKIFMIASDYKTGGATIDQVVERLKECDLSGYKSFKEDIKKIIEEIIAVGGNTTTAKPVINDEVISDTLNEKKKHFKKFVNDIND